MKGDIRTCFYSTGDDTCLFVNSIIRTQEEIDRLVERLLANRILLPSSGVSTGDSVPVASGHSLQPECEQRV